MAKSHCFTGMFLILSAYLLIVYQFRLGIAAPGNGNNLDLHRPRSRSLAHFAPKPINQYARIKAEPFDFLDDDDLFELSKRQASDDYGHLRFGKRDEQFDDYGHMRFGRSGAAEK